MSQAVDWNRVQSLLAAGQGVEAMALINPAAAPVAQAQPPQPQQPSLESRVAQLEQLVQKVAAPALDEAAKVGMSIMSALGNGMSHDQAAFVQSRLNSSPEFFASQGCKDAIDIFISEWKNYEGAKK